MYCKSPEELLNLVALRRKELQLDARVIASSANVSPKFISQLENGKTTIEIDCLARVTRALGLKIPFFDNRGVMAAEVINARNTLHLKQTVAAALCGVSPRFLSTIENDKPKKRLDKLFDVLRGLGLLLEVKG